MFKSQKIKQLKEKLKKIKSQRDKAKISRDKLKLELNALRQKFSIVSEIAYHDFEKHYRDTYKFKLPPKSIVDHASYKKNSDYQVTPSILYSGFLIAHQIKSVLAIYDAPPIKKILDFGCSYGRITRFLDICAKDAVIYGSDIDQEAIEWSQKNLSGVCYVANQDSPPLNINEKFDLIFVCSVFTHLPENLQLAWLEELSQKLNPGALMLATIHGKATERFIPKNRMEKFYENHFLQIDLGKTNGLPDYYLSTFHSPHYIERVWGKYFLIEGIMNQKIANQDLVICRQRNAGNELTKSDLSRGEVI